MSETRYPEAKPVEVWQDGTGCLYTLSPFGAGTWLVFGFGDVITEDNPLIDHPLTRVSDRGGNVLVKRLNYRVRSEA